MKRIEKIRQMTVEEFAEYLYYSNATCPFCIYAENGNCSENKSCVEGVIQYLNSEVEKVVGFKSAKV